MPSQLAVDLSRSRVRAVEFDGTSKTPKVKAFVAADVAAPAPPAEGEGAPDAQANWSYATGLAALAEQRRLPRDPSGVALASSDCTFRDLELPFTTSDQIDKVIKFEAESHLQLVEIDSVVVSYQPLDADGRGGSRLIAVACAKERIRAVLHDLNTIGIDPQTADLHLTALYTTLCFPGYLQPTPIAPVDAPPSERPIVETVMVLECDADVTHLLVARGDTLVAARAIRLGTAPPRVVVPVVATAPGGEAATAEAAAGDDSLVVVDDLSGDGGHGHGKKGGGDYFARLRREVQRTLFKLGPSAEAPSRVFVCGSAVLEREFASRLEREIGMPVEVLKPFERVGHELDGETLEKANAEGLAALGVALRMLGYAGGSRVELRQEEVRYARRFDQVKSALSTMAMVALVCVAAFWIDRMKRSDAKDRERTNAAMAALGEFQQHTESDALMRLVKGDHDAALTAVGQAKAELTKRRAELKTDLGRGGTIPTLPSGLDYLNAVVEAIDNRLSVIGRIEILSIDLDVMRGDEKNPKPLIKLKLYLTGPTEVDALMRALRESPAVATVDDPTTSTTKEGRFEVSNLDINLKPNWDARKSAKEEKAP